MAGIDHRARSTGKKFFSQRTCARYSRLERRRESEVIGLANAMRVPVAGIHGAAEHVRTVLLVRNVRGAS